LVGAGPGDPDLLTRKAEQLLAAATMVFYDALIGEGILDLIPVGVQRIFVGKRAGRHSRRQPTINDLLVRAAIAGERVVRLKGGDPAIFARTGEELDHLPSRNNGANLPWHYGRLGRGRKCRDIADDARISAQADLHHGSGGGW
jgi:siroheme synthase